MSAVARGTVVLVATRNPGKLAELLPMLAAAGLRAETLDEAGLAEDELEGTLEVHATFEANALAKARWFAERAPGRVVLADDSGLSVDALDGAPGVRSKRWSENPDLLGPALTEANNRRLIEALAAAAAGGREERTARFVCAAACVWPGGEAVRTGETVGTIVNEARGAGGFGYDPYFASHDLGARTFAEATKSEKGRVGHRGRAFAALIDAISSGSLDAEKSVAG